MIDQQGKMRAYQMYNEECTNLRQLLRLSDYPTVWEGEKVCD
uniref:Uncharacterized protein n=1 Tax=Heterorhabditis bacteriophora TaxID=37862 RepID=A0A1I7XFC6_HETBA